MVELTAVVVAIVDDDPRVLESLADLLESAGVGVRVFDSAIAFLASGALAQIDCVISDVGMPEMDGVELQRLARVARPKLPVILITGRDALAVYQDARVAKPREVFQKPFCGQQLLAAVERSVNA